MTAYEMEPEYVIPFQITKEIALENMHKRMDKGFYVSDKFTEYYVKAIPAYVPFWIVDTYYEDYQIWKYKEDSTKQTKYAKAGGRIHLEKLPVDGVRSLEDVITCGLGPYDYSKMIPNSQIMPVEDILTEESYKVKCEIGKEEAEEIAVKMIRSAFDREMKKKLNEASSDQLRSDPQFEIAGSQLVALPIWFLLIHAENRNYVAYVNGQTGKVVMTLPVFSEKAAISVAGRLLLIGGSIYGITYAFLSRALTGMRSEWGSALFAACAVWIPITCFAIYLCKDLMRDGMETFAKYKVHLKNVNAERNLSSLGKDL